MKKLTTIILGLSLIASAALYAGGTHHKNNKVESSNNHMGDHMHEGKMTNHMNPNAKTNKENNHMGNHMHEGKMTNHMNPNAMTNKEMSTTK
jgi:hypothetical protein